MSVLENVWTGMQRRLGTSFHFWKSDKTLSILNDRALDALEQVGLADFTDEEDVERVTEPIKKSLKAERGCGTFLGQFSCSITRE